MTAETQKRHPLLLAWLVLLTALLLLGLSFRVLLLPVFTDRIAEATVNDQLSAFGHDELVQVANDGRGFVVGKAGTELPVGIDQRLSFPPDVVSHMEDVRSVIQAALTVTLALALLLAASLAYAWRRHGRHLAASGLFFGGIAAVAAVLVLALIGVVSFDWLFTAMHKLLFADGTWTFAADSLLICAYPLAFWVGMAIAWAAILAFLSAFVSAIGFKLRTKAG
jgi:integral membrane protein (TIGR01906 family)